MEVIRGWVASVLVEKLVNEGLLNAERKLQESRITVLPPLKLLIEKAEGSAEGSAYRSEVEDWLQRLKDAYDDAEDALDLLNYHYLESKVKAEAEASGRRRRTNRVRFPFRVPKSPKWILPVFKVRRDMLSLQKIKLKRSLNNLVKISGKAEKLCTLLGVQPNQIVPPVLPYSRQTISLPPHKVFGRDEDRDEIILRLKMKSAAATGGPESTGIPVIAIVGRPGVGKTTLAQHVCQKLRAEELSNKHFDLVMWVFASCNFNVFEIMKNILQQASNPSETLLNVSMLDSPEVLHKEMVKTLNAKKFLLVLDDVWCDEEDHKINWDTLFTCLSKCCSPEGSKILVTSQTHDAPRKMFAAKGATVEYIRHLEELEENDFLDLFIHHALPSEEMDSSLRKDLEEKCKTIAKKLNKDPTAAKMVGETIAFKLADLLRSHDDSSTYLRMIVQKDWSGHKTEALMWSYRHLPAHLQRCFWYCSLYPRGYKFEELELVQLWMAQDFIKPEDQNERMEDIGNGYLKELESRFYIQRCNRVHSSFGTDRLVSYYMLHELVYDLAKKVSRNDCFRIEGNRQSEIPPTIRHLSIPAGKLNEYKEEICKLKKLRTLIVTRGESDTSKENVATAIFKSLKKLYVLVLELNLENLAEFISEMKHLRILQVSGTSEFVLPESVCTLYKLQALKVENARSLPKHLNNLVSLRYLQSSSGIANISKLTSLQGLENFQVSKEKGNELEQLQNLNELRGCLQIDNLENVKSKESAIAANLKEKKYLDELRLVWHEGQDNVNSDLDVEILEGLQLPPNLAGLYLKGYRGQLWPSWPKSQTSNIEELELWLCKMLEELPPMDQLYPSCRKLKLLDLPKLKALHTLPPRLQEINIIGTPFLTFATNEDLQMSPAEKRSIIEVMRKSMQKGLLHQYQESFVADEREMRNFIAAMNHSNNEASSAEDNNSVPANNMDFTSVWERWLGMYERKMELIYKRQEAKLLLPSTLTELYLKGCNITDHALSACLQTLTSLTRLWLEHIKTITCLPSEDVLSKLEALQDLSIWNSWALTSLGGIRYLPHLTKLSLENCPCLDGETAFLPSSLEIITFKSCADVDVILANAELPSLSRLEITRCHMRTASVDLQELCSLELLELWECSNLQEVMNFPGSLKHLRISGCPILERSINIDPCSRVLMLGGIPVEDLSGRPLIGEIELSIKTRMEPLGSIGLAALGWVASPLVVKLLNEGFASLGINADKKLQELKWVIEKAEGSEHQSEVEEWLQRLKDAYDDAEDALDLLNYHHLEQKVTEAASSSVCQGIINPIQDELRRSLKELEETANEADIFRSRLGVLPDKSDSRQPISLPPQKVFGRDEDREEIIRILKMEPAAAISEPGSSDIPIIAIVGRPGLGKTTLAQYVCEQLRSESDNSKHFNLVMWVDASRSFSASEIMKDIIQLASIASEPPDLGNLKPEVLRQKMNEKLKEKKFLLVLDDVWCDGDVHKNNWDTLFRCLSKCCLPGSKILVTSQTKNVPTKIVAAKSATVEYTHDLEELEENDFINLFIYYALPSSPEMDSCLREDLEVIGKRIAKKLNKDPTAAKMVGLSLQENLKVRYWRDTEQKDWSGDKTKALMWSYQHLPAHLQRCFSYCSLYPRGYKFKALELVLLWMAQGFIKPDDQDKRMEDVGNDYLEMLVSRFYIQSHGNYYTLHELLCDLAEKISRNDCVRIESNGHCEIPSTIRHLCIPADKLNEKKEEICELKKLRTLIVTNGERIISKESGTSEENVTTGIFKSLKKLRVLVLELYLENLAEFIGVMKHLRVLLVFSHLEFVLPESVCTLYLLQVLEVKNPSSLPKRLDNLVSLRYLKPDNNSAITDISKLTSLQCFEKILVSKEKGNELEQLRNLNELRGCLSIANLENVESKDSAIAANLKEKKYLDKLWLGWRDGEDNVNSNLDVEILEGLQLPPNLARLYLKGYRGQLWPSWPKSQASNIEELQLLWCKMLEELPPMDQLYPSCRSLMLQSLSKLKALHTLPPRLQKISIIDAPFLTFATNEDLQMSPAEKRSIIEVMRKRTPKWFLHYRQVFLTNDEKKMMNNSLFVSAADLVITVVWERWLEAYEQKMELIYNRQIEAKLLLPSTLTELKLDRCNITDHALSACLQTLTSLTDLSLIEIRTITCLPSEDVLGKLKALQSLKIWAGWTLISLGGIRSLPHLTKLSLEYCPCLDSETAFLPSSLENITFESCADVDVILANAELSYLSRLKIVRCHMRMASLQFGNLPSLRSLKFSDCPGLFSADLQKLSSLELLVLWNCSNLQKVLNFPGSLKSLRIQRCPILERSIYMDPSRNIDPSSRVLMLDGIPLEDFLGHPGEIELRRVRHRLTLEEFMRPILRHHSLL